MTAERKVSMTGRVAHAGIGIAIVAGAVLAASPLAAQDEALRELVEVVAGGEVLLGEVPSGFPAADAIPADARIVGSLDRGRSVTVVLAIPGDPAAAERRVRDTLRARGWTAPESMDAGPGFVSSGVAGGGDVLCRDDLYAMVDAAPLASGETRIRLNVAGRSGGSPCDARPVRFAQRESPIPTLTAPPGGRSTSHGMSSGSDGEYEAQTFLETALPVPEIAAHYGGQVEREGWEPTTERADNVVALRTYTKTDEDGQRLHGMLLIVAPPGTGGRLATFRVVPLTGRRP